MTLDHDFDHDHEADSTEVLKQQSYLATYLLTFRCSDAILFIYT
jgi:hypothetical protein